MLFSFSSYAVIFSDSLSLDLFCSCFYFFEWCLNPFHPQILSPSFFLCAFDRKEKETRMQRRLTFFSVHIRCWQRILLLHSNPTKWLSTYRPPSAKRTARCSTYRVTLISCLPSTQHIHSLPVWVCPDYSCTDQTPGLLTGPQDLHYSKRTKQIE